MSKPRQSSLGQNVKEGIPEGGEYVENLDTEPTQATYFNPETARLTTIHREYLLSRHGTFDLDPIPDMGGADPYNWQSWMVMISLYYTRLSQTLTAFLRRKLRT
jgi:hypothetical protein